MFNRAYLRFSVSVVILGLATSAMADVAPPDTYVEECTVEKKQTTTNECLKCQDTRAGDGANRCTKLLTPYCYTKQCDAWGGTAYAQVWCRSKEASSIVLPESIKSQLTGYTAPTLETGVGGAANCPTPTTSATGGAAPTTTTPTTSATGGTAPTTTAPTTSDSSDDGGCSVSRGANSSTVASLGFLGLVGLLLLRLRKR